MVSLSIAVLLFFCLQSKTLQHIVSSCKSYLDHGRYNWRHNSVLLCLSKSLHICTIGLFMLIYLHFHHPAWYVEIIFFLILSCIINISYFLELTVGFESNLKTNSERKLDKYRPLVLSLSSSYQKSKRRAY